MENTSNIFLQHTCNYTREGIKSLLSELESITPINLVADQGRLQPNIKWLMNNQNIDVFIFELQSHGNNLCEILSFIIKTLPVFYPEAKVVIMTQLNKLGRLKDYLSQLNNICAVLDNGITLQEMQLYLTQIIMLAKDCQSYPVQSSVPPLTYQELSVLSFLLKGKSSNEVASKLCIHYKKVSHHKQSALQKLGVHSLHDLLMNGNKQELMNQLLHYQ
ncbi:MULTISPECIES: helix-turn-helix domain-containing protein [unclassified Serratia (in: enterobacteria)]|uniref:helix-turn-helix domain-containing protein n=1 Tax=unclassified Serratia (in: enterobacteria) TaxID=2647522 RepID=UPI0030763562